MGASNVLAAYAKYAGKVPPLSMVLLAYMAAVSKDSDADPWFGMGHQALARYALGRAEPMDEADVRAVERAVAPLKRIGAIVTDRKAAPRGEGAKTVRYRLNLRLDSPIPPTESVGRRNVPRKSGDDSWADQPAGERPTESVRDVPRFPAGRPTVCDETPHENRGTEEQEEEGGAKGGGESGSSYGATGIARARDDDDFSIYPQTSDTPDGPDGLSAPLASLATPEPPTPETADENTPPVVAEKKLSDKRQPLHRVVRPRLPADIEEPRPRPAYTPCPACGTALDPDGSCFVCRTAPRARQAALP
jgi:hypothetical protein